MRRRDRFRVQQQAMDGTVEGVLSGATLLVVVAPHPDDDVLGCGALIACAARTMPVSVLYVTDGSASHVNSKAYPPERLGAVREREALRALRALGVREQPVFIRVRDGCVPPSASREGRRLIAQVRVAIPEDRRVVVAYPWRRDPHADHRAVAELTQQALRTRPNARAVEYAVWLGIIGDPAADAPRAGEGEVVAFDARPWLGRKRAALRRHRSQLGLVVRDAERAFVLPEALLARALGPEERFLVRHAAAG